MNALAVVEQDPNLKPLIDAMAIRMADEGVPVRSIARVTRLPSEEVYEIIKDAIGRGALVEIPGDDWPAGTTRASRSPFNSTPLDNEEELKFACVRCFKATRLEAAILALLLKRSEATKQQLHTVIEQNRPTEGRDETDPKMVDVLICHLRKKLRGHGIEIETVWGLGYLIPPAGRDTAVAILTAQQITQAA